MASFTAVDDELILAIPDRGETIDIALSGTYSMVIGLFMLEGFLCATGAEADPFSAAV